MTDSSSVLDEVSQFAGRFMVFSHEHYLTVVVLWIAHTWSLEAFYVTPRLVIDSAEPGSGKTRVLEVLSLLCHASKMTVSTSAAALYRRIANSEQPPTILQDEADAIFGRAARPEDESLRALFNSGYKRGATVDRCETVGKTIVVREFPVFAPVALAGLAGKMPRTILDRSVTLHMRKRAPDESVAEFRDRDASVRATPIRDRLEAWAADNFDALEAARPTMPEGVRDRPAEVWEALLAVADVAGGEWPDKARAACAHFVLQTDPDAVSLGVRLLRDLATTFGSLDRMFSADIVTELTRDEESEWADLWGKKLDQRRLAKELKKYGVLPSKIWIGTAQGRGYTVDGDTGLAQAWRRYVPIPTPERTNRTEGKDAGQSISGPYQDRTEPYRSGSERPERTETVPEDMRSDQQLFHSGTDIPLGTDGNGVPAQPTGAHQPSQPSTGTETQQFKPPRGPGRCPSCGCHVESQGHRADCTANSRESV